jgi:hypothetical protein
MSIFLGGVDYKPKGKIISLDKARQIAMSWHGGQMSPLYSFASYYSRQKNFDFFAPIVEVDDILKYTPRLTAKDVKDLEALKKFFNYKKYE